MINTFDDFLSDEECKKFIDQIHEKKNKVGFTNHGLFQNDKYVDCDLATIFFNKLKKRSNNNNFIKPNSLIMSGMYSSGDLFGLHTDTGLHYDVKNGMKSRYTLLIYLNDNFTGGETIFYDDMFNKIKQVQPHKGMGLIFDIDIWHEGKVVCNGHKYWIGCEIIGKINYA